MNPIKDLSYKILTSAKFELMESPLLGNPIEKKERGVRRKGALKQALGKENGRAKRHIPEIKGMSSIQDVPNLLSTGGNGILAIPKKLDIEI